MWNTWSAGSTSGLPHRTGMDTLEEVQPELIRGFKHLISDERMKESKENKGRLFSATRDKRDEVEIKEIPFYDSIT